MKAFWVYTVARLALFAVTFLAVWGLVRALSVPMSVPFVIIVAFIISGVVSLFALRGLREDFASKVQARAGRMADKVEKSRGTDDID